MMKYRDCATDITCTTDRNGLGMRLGRVWVQDYKKSGYATGYEIRKGQGTRLGSLTLIISSNHTATSYIPACTIDTAIKIRPTDQRA